MHPKISVIIPSYNHEKYIGEAIESVLSQTLNDFELIIIDDGSTDASVEIISTYADQDPRIAFYTQKNSGSHATINRGMRLAKGDFLSILNSDDRYEPTRLATLLNFCEHKKIDFVVTGVKLIDGEGVSSFSSDHWWVRMYVRLCELYYTEGPHQALVVGNYGISTSNFFFHRCLLDQVGYFRNLRCVLDWDYLFRVLEVAPNCFAALLDLPLLDYRLHGNNTILKNMARASIESHRLLSDILYRKVGSDSLAGRIAHQIHLNSRFFHRRVRSDSRTKMAILESQKNSFEAKSEVLERQVKAFRQYVSALENSRSYRIGRWMTAPLRMIRQFFYGNVSGSGN